MFSDLEIQTTRQNDSSLSHAPAMAHPISLVFMTEQNDTGSDQIERPFKPRGQEVTSSGLQADAELLTTLGHVSVIVRTREATYTVSKRGMKD